MDIWVWVPLPLRPHQYLAKQAEYGNVNDTLLRINADDALASSECICVSSFVFFLFVTLLILNRGLIIQIAILSPFLGQF